MGFSCRRRCMARRIKDRYTWLPGDFAEFVPRMLTELCFGDYMSRDGLDGKTRELLTVVLLAALGGAEVQVREPCGGRAEGRQLQGGTGLRARACRLLHGHPAPVQRVERL